MQCDKVTVTIKMESLSIQTLRGMLMDVIELVEHEAESGELKMQDGDCITWNTERTPVSF